MPAHAGIFVGEKSSYSSYGFVCGGKNNLYAFKKYLTLLTFRAVSAVQNLTVVRIGQFVARCFSFNRLVYKCLCELFGRKHILPEIIRQRTGKSIYLVYVKSARVAVYEIIYAHQIGRASCRERV